MDEFLAKEGRMCSNPKEMADTIAKNGFALFLGIKCEVTKFEHENESPNFSFNLVFSDNPLNDYVELPDEFKDLNYSAIIPGVLSGAMAMIHIDCKCIFLKDTLRGDEINELKLECKPLKIEE